MGEEGDLFLDEAGLLEAILDGVVVGCDLAGGLGVHGPPDPLHLVLVDLLDVADALEDVGDVVDTSLLHT